MVFQKISIFYKLNSIRISRRFFIVAMYRGDGGKRNVVSVFLFLFFFARFLIPFSDSPPLVIILREMSFTCTYMKRRA